MAKRVNTLSNEKLVENKITENTQENDVQSVEEITENKENISNKQEKKNVEKSINNIVKGDRVKIDPKLSNDMLGRRIHNGVKNYTYTVLNVRSDGFCSIECLTHVFCVHKDHLTKI